MSCIVLKNAAVNMLLFWGYPTSENYCTLDTTSGTFQDCLNLCLGKGNCMLAYGSDGNCNLCDIYATSSITQTTASNGIQIGVKVDTLKRCPVDLKDVQYTKTDTLDSYTLSYSDPTWTISYDKKCIDDSWKMFIRPQGGACLKVFKKPGLNQSDSGTLCKENGAGYELSGMQSKLEWSYIMESARALIGSVPTRDYTTVWLGGTMRPYCYPDNRPSNCTGIQAFENFPYQDNFDAYVFTPGSPNFTRPYPGQEYYNACLQLNLKQNKEAWDGKVTNVMCQFSCNGGTAICAVAYACVGLAT
ncbi:hypothetical protein B9Z55_012842 [Caenorhabditis nigoni]|uniref:PAN-3 domain-containing protein n=2 Tax=Caenorhabditis nigoni TaxID=1611254 RepID=A0A2G5TZ26_9PELO|nr:hypothetical protein B9Z55_012842 [Caenorhabditis nigoni]